MHVKITVGILLVAFFLLWATKCLFRVCEYLRTGRAEYRTKWGRIGAGVRSQTPFAFWGIVAVYAISGLFGIVLGIGMLAVLVQELITLS